MEFLAGPTLDARAASPLARTFRTIFAIAAGILTGARLLSRT